MHAVHPRDDVSGLHAVTAVSAATMTTQFYVSEVEEVFKIVCGKSCDFLASMQTEEEEEAAAAVSAASVDASTASELDRSSHVHREDASTHDEKVSS